MLNQKIRETVQNFREVLPAELSALIEQGAGEISALDIIERARKPGDLAPDFTLKNPKGESRRLTDYLAVGPLVITFYRGAWCPYCNLQLKEYNDHLAEIKAAGATLVAITPEKPGALDILAKSGAPQEVVDMALKPVEFDVLHDPGNQIAESYGVVFKLPESHRQLLEQLHIDIEALNGDTSFTFPDPATYVIRPTGEIAWAFVPNNYRKRAEVAQILTALQDLTS
ncbi:AhpC/Tsa family protein GSU0066 [hydrothermal vent metagenome]|uniref:thioredoxin-dependent peroxiredoxin n=1 Tax=hydrothermal vent metagenome TaxID=652676 RepID=A0A3B1BPX9_9ZZZZ